MPTTSLMVWIPSQKRWTKRYAGRRYYVSCRQLGIKPETKEASILAANQWWRDRQADIDHAEMIARQQTPRRMVPGEDLATAAILAGVTPTLRQTLAELAHNAGGSAIFEPIQNDPNRLVKQALGDLLFRSIVDGEPLPAALVEHLPPARLAGVERAVTELRGEQTADVSKSVNALTETWISSLRISVRSGVMSASRFAKIQVVLRHFAAFLSDSADVSAVNAAALEGFHNFCLAKTADEGWSPPHAKDVFAVARQWVSWMVERGTIPAPANLNRRWRFGPTVKPIETWTVDECRAAVNAAKGKVRLCVLLMLNCGMTQKDVSDLKDNEVDWQRGRITRKRSKTRGHANAPTVSYPLWPEAFALLKEHRSGTERVLLTASGEQFTGARMVDGKVHFRDSLGGSLVRLIRGVGIRRLPKQLRKTSATMLENHVVTLPSGELVNPFASCVTLFLGHSPRSMKDKHYAGPPQALFDSAVTWLGSRFGFC